MNIKKILTNGQNLGVVIMIVGLIYEAIFHAHIGWLIFSSGTLIFTVATKIKYYKKQRS